MVQLYFIFPESVLNRYPASILPCLLANWRREDLTLLQRAYPGVTFWILPYLFNRPNYCCLK